MLSDPEIEALSAYDDLYYGLESNNKSTEDQQNFCEPLQSSNQILQIKLEDESSLGGSQELENRSNIILILAPTLHYYL